jgi:hypothetical protein
MNKLALDPSRSSLRIHTFAEGLFARLAHDLELACRGVSGTAERSGEAAGRATLEIPISGIEVAGTLRSGRLDPDGLTGGDRANVLAKMRSEVFHSRGPGDVVRATGTLEAGRAQIEVTTPGGRKVARATVVELREEGDRVLVVGEVDLSLRALGSDPVKGPMNAFRMKDEVVVSFELVFA